MVRVKGGALIYVQCTVYSVQYTVHPLLDVVLQIPCRSVQRVKAAPAWYGKEYQKVEFGEFHFLSI